MGKTILEEGSYQRTVFDAIPSPALILDAELCVLDLNRAASVFFGGDRTVLLKHLCGEVLQCLNEKEAPGGCGTSEFCKDCVVRNAGQKALRGQDTVRGKYDMQLQEGTMLRNVNFLISAAPFRYAEKSLALVILEDITELTQLRKFLSICMQCKKIRSEDGQWVSLEYYFSRQKEIQFSHGLCPDCAKNFKL
jgi:PAS domain-containing protein